jgi:hypothetical protein
MALSPAEPDGARQREDGASPEGVMNWVPFWASEEQTAYFR